MVPFINDDETAMKILRVVAASLAFLSVAGCPLSGDPVSGQVLKEDDHKPIEGAIVVVRWIGRTTSGSWFTEAKDVCYHVESTKTDQRGQYKTPLWSQEQRKDYKVKYHSLRIVAYKPGHGFSRTPSQTDEVLYLEQFRGTQSERLEYLSRVFVNTSCGSENASEKNLLPIRRALYDEAKDLAKTPKEKNTVETILYGLEILEFGFEAAERRHLQRSEK